jgi:uncharacterized protein (TIGR02246 family)
MTVTVDHAAGQDLLDAWKRAWEGRDPDRFMALFGPDAELRPDPFEPPLAGANAIRAHWNAFAAANVHTEFDAERLWVADGFILASWHGATTDRATAARRRHRGFLAFEIDADGLIERARGWPVTREVGVDSTASPEPVTAGEGG